MSIMYQKKMMNLLDSFIWVIAEMEELLNKLIEKGWRPFGRVYQWVENNKLRYINLYDMKDEYIDIDLRSLVSKESGLWQFCTKNWMIKSETWVWVNAVDNVYKEILINQYDYKYRLIESALCDEDKLEQFLLDNIKIWNYEN